MSARPAPDVLAVVVAAGRSTRMGGGNARKPWLPLGGGTVLETALAPLADHPRVGAIALVVHPDDLERARRAVADGILPGITALVPGGRERIDSVTRGLEAAGDDLAWVAVHDAARPGIDAALLTRLFAAAEEAGAAIPALAVPDTLKREGPEGWTRDTVPREALRAAQTPQVFARERFRGLLERARREGFRPTDDSALWERYAGPVRLVEGTPLARKITWPADLPAVEAALGRGGPCLDTLRIGTGFDIHRLVEGRRCVLGGVELPHPRGPAGHSDGDAVLHALADALLGAAGLDDLGSRFPDTDPAHRGRRSGELLEEVVAAVREAGWRIVNADLVVATEGPRIAPHRAAMRERIGGLLGIEPDRVNLKGKSLEGLGALAGGAGVAVQAVCLLERV